jgi:hypothetical protein
MQWQSRSYLRFVHTSGLSGKNQYAVVSASQRVDNLEKTVAEFGCIAAL